VFWAIYLSDIETVPSPHHAHSKRFPVTIQ